MCRLLTGTLVCGEPRHRPAVILHLLGCLEMLLQIILPNAKPLEVPDRPHAEGGGDIHMSIGGASPFACMPLGATHGFHPSHSFLQAMAPALTLTMLACADGAVEFTRLFRRMTRSVEGDGMEPARRAATVLPCDVSAARGVPPSTPQTPSGGATTPIAVGAVRAGKVCAWAGERSVCVCGRASGSMGGWVDAGGRQQALFFAIVIVWVTGTYICTYACTFVCVVITPRSQRVSSRVSHPPVSGGE